MKINKYTTREVVSLLVVDYLQQIQNDVRGSRFEAVTEISSKLKDLAIQANAPALVLSQLSRRVEERDDKRPMLMDLRESGQLEQDANTVLFAYRDEYYLQRIPLPKSPGALADLEDAKANAKGVLEIIVAKQRTGALGTAKVKFDAPTNLISSLQEVAPETEEFAF